MKLYKITIIEKREGTFSVEAESLAEAKDKAKWRLLTQTNPAIEPQYTASYHPKDIKEIKDD